VALCVILAQLDDRALGALCRERARLRTGIGLVSALEPLEQRAFNFTAAEPDYWRRAREDPCEW
jgi:hypothetical protein